MKLVCRLLFHKKTPGCPLSVSAAHAVAQFALLHDHTWMTGNCHNYRQLVTHHHPQLGWQDARLHITPIFIFITHSIESHVLDVKDQATQYFLFNCPFTCLTA